MRKLLLSASVLLMSLPAIVAQTAAPEPPKTMPIPTNYREWQYLTSGTDMSYNEPTTTANATGHTMFDNIFVNREAWEGFKQSGTWPNGTVLVLENRMGEGNVSINKQGKTQNAEVMGLEIHTKVNSQWAFYVRGSDGQEHLVAKPAGCYTCHEAHAAADTTFAQFYPTVLPVAKSKGTVSAEYLKELAVTQAK
jgi:hypothetical protein